MLKEGVVVLADQSCSGGSEEERRERRDKVGRGVGSLYGHGDEKSGSRVLPKPEKHFGWRCWGNPSQVN